SLFDVAELVKQHRDSLRPSRAPVKGRGGAPDRPSQARGPPVGAPVDQRKSRRERCPAGLEARARSWKPPAGAGTSSWTPRPRPPGPLACAFRCRTDGTWSTLRRGYRVELSECEPLRRTHT